MCGVMRTLRSNQAFSNQVDLIKWYKEDSPLYRAGGHPDGIDAEVILYAK